MKPAPFDYVAPDSLAGALSAMEQHGFDAKALAGGQSLIPAMNFRLAQPAVLVDLNAIEELDYISPVEDGSIRIGAMTRHGRLERDNVVQSKAPLLFETMPFIAHPQIRNRGTIGGSLAHADPAAELPVIAVTRQAKFKLQRLGDARWVTAESFFQGLFTCDLEPEELLVEIAWPAMPARTGYAFTEVARRHGDYALAGAAALITLDDQGLCRSARLVFLNVGEIPMIASRASSALVGQRPQKALFEEVARSAVAEEIDPAGDVHASSDFKRHLARVMAVRALTRAEERAGGPLARGPG